MCGIAGVFSLNSNLGAEHRCVITRLNAWQAHRGPDGEGLWSSDDHSVSFGHRRLAIIDTGSSGNQPMSDVTGRWTITFNGEIYNYQVVRAELNQLGYRFATHSDTEVLINAVAAWGFLGLRKLRGMYAFALWDNRNKELWLARDPYGIKPLYVAQCNDLVWFASQARALAECVPLENKRDPAALAGFYLWGHVPEPFSWWENIEMLRPGSVQRFQAGKKIATSEVFFDIPETYAEAEPHNMSREEIRDAVKDSVQHHLVADIPVGVFLSAGIDSNVVAAFATELRPGTKLRTITLGFDEYAGTPEDEVPLAEEAARALGSDHVTVRIGKEEFDTILDHFFARMDQPSIDGLNTYLISRAAAAQGLKVVLSGLGGDELFGGYPSFRQVPLLISMGRVLPSSKWLRDRISGTFRHLLPRGVPPKMAGAIHYVGEIGAAYLFRRSLHLTEELATLLDETWLRAGLEKLQTESSFQRIVAPVARAGKPVHAQVSVLESCCYMRNQLLRDSDWASMAHGVELRVPFVDVGLLEWLAPAVSSAAPPSKQDLASCAKHFNPILAKRPKTGFTTPVAEWIRDIHEPRTWRLHGWADTVHRRFRTPPSQMQPLLGALAS